MWKWNNVHNFNELRETYVMLEQHHAHDAVIKEEASGRAIIGARIELF